jgi:myo-inositol 2-dehydrogenase/D-chiro-inositol 1-dehydrogenase
VNEPETGHGPRAESGREDRDGPIGFAVVGAGRMGAFHAETLARRPGARLLAISDPVEEGARRLLARPELEGVLYERDYQKVLADPEVRAVVVASPGGSHPELIAAAAEAGKHVFSEKPLGYELAAADRALAAVERAGVLFQLGFQRRFDAGFRRARALVADGSLGKIELLRSLTRDPELPFPAAMPPWALFRETLTHDFDVVRWLAGSEAIEVFAMADTLFAPGRREEGQVDTAVVRIRFADGALATVDGSFRAVYGYDVRAEVFGSGGMVTVGDGAPDAARHYTREGIVTPRPRWFLDLFAEAYAAELADFVDRVADGAPPAVTGADGRASLLICLAAIESVQTGRPVRVADVG